MGIEIVFLLNTPQLRHSFLGRIQSANKAIKGLYLISVAGSLISSICFLFFSQNFHLTAYITHLFLHVVHLFH